MATRDIVPRNDSEGGIGTAEKRWASGYFDVVVADSISLLNPPIHPELYGAVGDGTTDDTAALESCVAAITSTGEIILKRGKTYKVMTAVAIGSKNIKFSGGGTVKLGADVYAFSVAGGTLELDGLSFTTATSATGNVATALSASTGIFRNNTVTSLKGGFHNYWNNSIFENNTITLLPATDLGSYAIHLPGSGNKVVNNRFTGGRHHVYISGGPDPTSTDPVENNIIDGNTCTGAGYGALAIYALSTQGAAQYNRLTNNIIIDTVAQPCIDVNTNAVSNVISGNTIYGFAAGQGISIEGVALTTAGKRPYNNLISDNIIVCKVTDETTYRNIRLIDGYMNTIMGNLLIHPAATTHANAIGVNLDSQTTPKAYRNSVTDNRFINCRLNNATIDSTQIFGNSFYCASGQTPIAVDSSGTANVGDNSLGSDTIETFTAQDATPSVKNGTFFLTANTVATSITTFDNGYLGQEVTVLFNDAVTTLVDVTGGGGSFRLLGGMNHTFVQYDVVTFVKKSATEWWEVARAVKSVATTATYDLSTASGTQSLTGVGFTPASVIVYFGTDDATCGGVGMATATTNYSLEIMKDGAAACQISTSTIIFAFVSVGNRASATIAFTSDGGTLTWTKVGSPTGTLGMTFLWFR